LQLKIYLSGGSFPVVKQQPPLCTNHNFRWSVSSLPLSLVTRVTKRLAVI
jgi:hypothetical protein